MKTAMQSTSLEAYDAIEAEGRLTRQQKIIVDAVKVGRNYSLQELVKITGLPINTISGRCNDLRHLGVLELGPTRACGVTGRQIHPVRLPAADPPQGVLFS